MYVASLVILCVCFPTHIAIVAIRILCIRNMYVIEFMYHINVFMYTYSYI